MDRGHIDVLIVDADLARLAFLITRLEYEPDLRVVGYATCAADAVGLAQSLSPDIVLSDFDLPDVDGLTQLGVWRATVPAAAIVLYTAQWSESLKRAARLNGADECLDKTVPPSQIIRALRNSLERRSTPAQA